MLRILVVEDSLDHQTIYDVILRQYQLKIVGTVKEGVAALTAEDYDIVILDYDLPDGHGTDVGRWLIENNKDDVHQIYCTAYADRLMVIQDVISIECVYRLLLLHKDDVFPRCQILQDRIKRIEDRLVCGQKISDKMQKDADEKLARLFMTFSIGGLALLRQGKRHRLGSGVKKGVKLFLIDAIEQSDKR